MIRPEFDAIIIGGGPAGSMTAYHLAKSGLRAVVLDAKIFPRNKACGGGLQSRAALNIPFDLGQVLRGSMRSVSFSFALRDPCTRSYPQPLVYAVLRREFDNYLLGKAEEAGAQIRVGTRIRSFEIADGAVVVRTDSGDLKAYFLVGADGANSIVRPVLNGRENYFWQAAVYCEIPEHLLQTDAIREECMRIDWGTLPSGYAWVFPKRGYVNVGVGGPVAIGKLFRPYLAKFLEWTHVLKPGVSGQLEFTGHQLPTLTRRTRLANQKVLLVGDAAGLVEPFTGDGISFAVHSARIAADCIRRALAGATADVSPYDGELKAQIGSEILLSRKLLALSVAFPGAIYKIFKQNDIIWQTFCRILRGEESFRRLRKEILGPLRFASRIVDLFTRLREKKAVCPQALPLSLEEPSACR